MAHQLHLAHIRPHHADRRYPNDSGLSHHDGHPSLRNVDLKPAADGRKTRGNGMSWQDAKKSASFPEG